MSVLFEFEYVSNLLLVGQSFDSSFSLAKPPFLGTLISWRSKCCVVLDQSCVHHQHLCLYSAARLLLSSPALSNFSNSNTEAEAFVFPHQGCPETPGPIVVRYSLQFSLSFGLFWRGIHSPFGSNYMVIHN